MRLLIGGAGEGEPEGAVRDVRGAQGLQGVLVLVLVVLVLVLLLLLVLLVLLVLLQLAFMLLLVVLLLVFVLLLVVLQLVFVLVLVVMVPIKVEKLRFNQFVLSQTNRFQTKGDAAFLAPQKLMLMFLQDECDFRATCSVTIQAYPSPVMF